MKKWSTKEPKFWKVMKVCAVQAVLAMVLFGASIAHDGAGQVLDKRLTLEVKDATLESILEKIEGQVGVKFVYNPSFFNLEEKVTISIQEAPLKDVLRELFESRRIEYQIYEKEQAITLRRAKNETGHSLNSENTVNVAALVTGRVTGGSGSEALAGVNVLIKGTTVGTTTDADGRYSIQADDNSTLVFSFIGFLSYETQVNGRTVIDVVLTEDSKKLEEVMVKAGYWEVDSKEQTGNISRITAREIQQQPVINPLQAMQGRMPGVQITQVSGNPGDGFSIQIRGLNSVRGGTANDPLYVIDGVPFPSATLYATGGNIVRAPNPLSAINPMDIESIEVLKDADATAIYGSRGANGVVLVTTKKGAAGRLKVEANVYTGVGSISKQLDMLNTSQYVGMRKEAFKNDGVNPTIANAPDLLLWDTTRYTDWKKKLIGGTAHLTNAQINLSGGSALTHFQLGGGFFRQTTVFPGDFGYRKGSFHINLSQSTADSKFNLNFSTNFVADNNYMPQNDPTIAVFSLAPNAPQVYKADGTLNWENGTWNNPFGDLKRTYTSSSKNLISNLAMSYEIAKGLKLKANTGYNFLSTEEKSITPIAAFNPAVNATGSALSSKGSINTWIFEPQAEYQRQLGSGKLIALVGVTFQQTLRDRQGYNASGYINDTQLENLAAAATILPYALESTEYKYNALFARVNYNLREKYIFNLTGRRDGSSRFGPGNRFANFGAIGTAWVFSKEPFMANTMPALSFGKIRASYGVAGSDQIGDYQYLDTYASTANTYQGGKGLIPSRLANPDYSWEQNRKAEIGIDLSFFQEKLYLSASYYNSRSSNQLVGYSLPAITGFSTVQSNLAAEIQNSGIEIVLSNVNIRRGSFEWTSSFNATFPRNRLVSYPNIEGSSYANTYVVGRSLFVQKKYNSTGVDPQSGLYTFEDVDKNGTLSSTADTQFIKERTTDFYGGLQNNLKFGPFELQFFFRFANQVGYNYLYSVGAAPGTRSNQPTYVLARWQRAGDITDVQRYTQGGAGTTAYGNMNSLGDNVLSDASYLRLQNASLSWTLPASVSGKISAREMKVYLQGQNLFVITDYKGADPETQNPKALSQPRVVSIGAQLTF